MGRGQMSVALNLFVVFVFGREGVGEDIVPLRWLVCVACVGFRIQNVRSLGMCAGVVQCFFCVLFWIFSFVPYFYLVSENCDSLAKKFSKKSRTYPPRGLGLR